MDSLLSSLFDDQGDAEEQRARAQDFVNRVAEGDPTQGFSDEEAVKNYDRVAGRLSPQELQEATTEAMDRFTPEQRKEFADLLKKQGGDAVRDVNYEDPNEVANLVTELQTQNPNGLVGMLSGGGIEDILGALSGGGSTQGGAAGMISSLVGGLLGGGKGGQSGGIADLLNSPVAKGVLASIAAMAMKKFMGGDESGDTAPPSDDKPRRSGGLKGADARDA